MINNLVNDEVCTNPLTRALVLNAVFFKAPWSSAFDANSTTRGLWHPPGGEPVACALMQSKPKSLPFAESAAGLLVALPYADGRYRALFALPAAADGLTNLTAGGCGAMTALRAALGSQSVQLSLPRFSLDYGAKSLKDALVALGLRAAFEAGDGAFGAMSDDPDLHLSDVLQKARLEVSEEGTRAAAATAAVMMTRAAVLPPEPRHVVLDRPFIMLVEEAATGVVIFAGAVTNPAMTGPIPPA